MSHIIYVHFNYLCFHVHVTFFVLALGRERKAKLPLFFSSQSSLQRESQPLRTFVIHTSIPPFPCAPPFLTKGMTPLGCSTPAKGPTVALAHSIIIFSGLFSKPSSSNSPALLPLSAAACWAELFTQAMMPFRAFSPELLHSAQTRLLSKSCFHWHP